jgi:DNA-directed RNA polymerase subunit RPC12/RpoP
MLTREEKFYELAAREVSENRLSLGLWGKAYSLAVGNEQKALALYIKLRADQLQREHQQTIVDMICDSWSDITAGRPFICPYCENRTTAKGGEVDFFVQLFKGLPPYQYHCKSCGTELHKDVSAADSAKKLADSAKKVNNGAALTGFILGLASIILFFIGIIPILAVVFSSIGLATFKPEVQKNKWMAGVGLALGILYTIMMLSLHRHLR